MVSKKEKEAKTLMSKIAKENGMVVDVDDLYDRFQKHQVSGFECFILK